VRRVQRRPNTILNAVFPILIVFLFAVFTGLPEMVAVLGPYRPMLVLATVGLIAVVITGRVMKVVMSPIGRVLLLFTLWFILCIPFAIWRGGSFSVFVETWSKSFLAYVMTAGLISTAAQERKVFNTIAYAVGALACLALRFNYIGFDGRLSLPSGRYANANDLALTLLIGLVFLGFLYLGGGKVKKITALLLMIPVLIVIARTGSRSAVLGAGILLLFMFFHASAALRAKLIIALPVLFVGLVLVVPSGLRNRYTTLFKANESMTQEQVDAFNSSEARLKLLKDSIAITIRHPLFGTGPGNFMVAQSDLASARGEPYGLWHVTHNSYTQLSSEVGIPGLLIYLAFLVQCWRELRAIRKKKVSRDVRVMAQTLGAALVILVTIAFFDSFAYNTNLPILAGLITALSFIAQAQRSSKTALSKSAGSSLSAQEAALEPAWSGPPY
jgi:O-antigen ligase